MKIKGIATVVVGILLCFMLIMPPLVQAGSTARHRWEGAAIGFGVGALLAGVPFIPPPVVVGPVPVPVPVPYPEPRWIPGPPPPRDRHWDRDDDHHWRHRPPRHHHRESRRIWVPPVYEDFYRDGHYNRWGEWIPGRWERRIVRPGFWRDEPYWGRR